MGKKKVPTTESKPRIKYAGALSKELENKASGYSYTDKIKRISYLGNDHKIIQWGQKNSQPQLLDKLSTKGGFHASCLNTRYKYTAGKLQLNGPDGLAVEAPAPNDRGDSYADLWALAVINFIKYGIFGLEFAYTTKGLFDQLFLRSGADLRAEAPDHYGVIPAYFLSKTWAGQSQNYQYQLDDGKVSQYRRIAAFGDETTRGLGTKRRPKDRSQILVTKQLSETSEVNPTQDWIGALEAILLAAQINNSKNSIAFNMANLSAVLLYPKDVNALAKDETIDDIVDDLDDEFLGTENHGKVPYMFYKPGDEAPSFMSAPENRGTKVFDTWEEANRFEILSHHNILFPEIIGIPNSNTGLGTEDIAAKFQIFFNISLRALQVRVLKAFDTAIELQLGPGYTFEVIQEDVLAGLEPTEPAAPGSTTADPADATSND